MYKYKFDTHVHTSEVSGCARLTAAETIKLYSEKEFSGVVITDHYTEDFFRSRKELPWEEQIAAYLRGYTSACKYAERVGMTVLPGMELRLRGSSNEYLLYGMNMELYINLRDMYSYSLEQLREVTKKHNITVFQAHPFRRNMTAIGPEYMDGCEVYNGNPRHNSRNDVADEFAEQNKLLKIAGSDCHQIEDVAQGGVVLKKIAESPRELADEIIAGNALLIKDGIEQ